MLFKKFVGVAAARLDDQFSSENFASVPNIFSKDVMIEEIPSAAPLKIMGTGNLDASANWSDSSYNLMTNQIEESIFNDFGVKPVYFPGKLLPNTLTIGAPPASIM